jgi:hypothetical protein
VSDYYSIEIRVRFGVLAESKEEAETIAGNLVEFDDYPPGADPTVDAYLTPNQSDDIKRHAANYEGQS